MIPALAESQAQGAASVYCGADSRATQRAPASRNMPVFAALAAACRSLGLAALCLLFMGQTAPGAVPEYKSKAALIFNIGKFVQWPEDAFTKERGVLKLCIAGRDDFGDSIDSLAGQTLQGRVIAVARLAALEQATTECHIVFISDSERERVPAFLNSIAGSPVLTISDIDGFASEGGMVGFATTARKIHFEINAAASKRARLVIGAQLLQLATVIEDQRMDVTP